MRAYLIRRVLLVIPTLFLVTILVFLSVRFIPGNVIDVMVARMGYEGGGTIDIEAAKQICRDDDLVDALHEQVYRELLTYMLQDPRSIHQATYLTWVGHNLERIADRSTNICERVVFTATGKMEEIGASKY